MKNKRCVKGSFLFLGTGGSTGVPMVGCPCSVCHSPSKKNKRFRPSGLIKIGDKRIAIDTGPDFRSQALRYGITHLDGVLLTHTHFDHVAGLDELRSYYIIHQAIIPVLVSLPSLDDLKKRYDYLFREKTWGVSLSAQLHFQVLKGERGETSFIGLPIRYLTYSQGGMPVNGYRLGDFAYVSDIKDYPNTLHQDLKGIKTLVISALRETPSKMHLSISEAIDLARAVGAQQTYFTHISHEVDHVSVSSNLPKGFFLAYDGLNLKFEITYAGI